MPKLTMSFKLPEEEEEFNLAKNGIKNSIVIEELDNFLRGKIKYGEHPDAIEAIYQEVRDKLWELRNES